MYVFSANQCTVVHVVLTIASLIVVTDGDGIGCFSCTSINHSDPHCEDTFNNTGGYYIQNCHAPRSGRTGMFPGTQCIKMIAEDESTGFSMIVRKCVADNGGTNSETEIGRMGHCGWMRVIKYDGRRMRGCVVTCDTDGCNDAQTAAPPSWIILVCVSLAALLTTNLATTHFDGLSGY